MNEDERSSQVSALFDGELDPAQAGLVIRRLLKDPALRASWGHYALIGASLRGEPLATGRRGWGDVASRVRLALEREPALLAVAPPAATAPPGAAPMRNVAWGSALAAGVALVAVLVMRAQAPQTAPLLAAAQPVVAASPGVAPVARASVAPAPVPETPAPSYTTPVDARPAGTRLSTPLVNYVVAHSEYTTPIVRFSPLSAVITGNFDPTENTVEMTAAEVGARR
jgi:sigma-E factor negative regulatory protein RseA